MINDREKAQPQQRDTAGNGNLDQDQIEQFNELSELSLEERMNVADRMGIPVESAGEAAATGTASGTDDVASSQIDRLETDRQHKEEER